MNKRGRKTVTRFQMGAFFVLLTIFIIGAIWLRVSDKIEHVDLSNLPSVGKDQTSAQPTPSTTINTPSSTGTTNSLSDPDSRPPIEDFVNRGIDEAKKINAKNIPASQLPEPNSKPEVSDYWFGDVGLSGIFKSLWPFKKGTSSIGWFIEFLGVIWKSIIDNQGNVIAIILICSIIYFIGFDEEDKDPKTRQKSWVIKGICKHPVGWIIIMFVMLCILPAFSMFGSWWQFILLGLLKFIGFVLFLPFVLLNYIAYLVSSNGWFIIFLKILITTAWLYWVADYITLAFQHLITLWKDKEKRDDVKNYAKNVVLGWKLGERIGRFFKKSNKGNP